MRCSSARMYAVTSGSSGKGTTLVWGSWCATGWSDWVARFGYRTGASVLQQWLGWVGCAESQAGVLRPSQSQS